MIIVMMYGFPAVGKTYISKKLEKALKRKYDVARLSTLDIRAKTGLFDLESDKERDKVYSLLAGELSGCVEKKDKDVLIVDGNFNKEKRRKKIYAFSKKADIYILECVVSDKKEIVRRMEARRKAPEKNENKASSMALYEMIKKTADPVEKDAKVSEGFVGLIRYDSRYNNVIGDSRIKTSGRAEIINDIIKALNRIKGE